MRFLKTCLSISLLALAVPALAQVPIIFERTDISINPAPLGGKNGEVVLQRPAVKYNIELRSEDALQLEYVHTLNTLTDTTGVMILFNTPTAAPLPAWQVFTPVDAVFIADTGEILQMLPNVTLAEMQQDISAKEPVKAFLFLKAGQIKTSLLRPHDMVAGNMFTPAPAVMQ